MYYNSKCIKFFILAIEYCDNDAETNNIYIKNVYDAKNTNNIYSYQI